MSKQDMGMKAEAGGGEYSHGEVTGASSETELIGGSIGGLGLSGGDCFL